MLKLICTNETGVKPGTVVAGKEYEICERWKGIYEVNDTPVSLSNFETPIDVLKRLKKFAGKVIIQEPRRGETVEILITDNYLICYAHTKGNHWNISGNHYRYYHNIRTGEFIPEHEANRSEKVLLKQRLLKADYKAVMSINPIPIP